MIKIKDIKSREILDSRGNPTIETDVILSDGSLGRSAVPSGTSTGNHEAIELRDKSNRYNGLGVKNAVNNVNGQLKNILINKDFNQETLDRTMINLDGTVNKNRLGANAILSISMSFAKAFTKNKNVPLYKYFYEMYGCLEKYILPVPLINVINGGKHAQNSMDLQEFMIVPHGAPNFSEALRYGAETFHTLKKVLTDRNLNTAVGDEGGYAPKLSSNDSAIKLLLEAIERAGYKPGKDISIAIDCAANEIFDVKTNTYNLKTEGKSLNSEEMANFYSRWCSEYPIISIEDPFFENDWKGFTNLTNQIGSKIQIVGDDLFTTNTKYLQMGINSKAANAILIKLNQIGTITEAIDTIKMAKQSGFNTIISHRSGETEDTTIADFAVGLNAGQIKTGSMCRSERIAKYNQLLRIEEELGAQAEFLGSKIYQKKNI